MSRTFVLLALACSTACSKKEAPPPPPVLKATPAAVVVITRPTRGYDVASACQPMGSEQAKAEVSGKYQSSAPANATLWFYLSTKPCDVTKPVTVVGSATKVTSPDAFAAQVLGPQGTLVFACMAAIADEKVVGYGYAPNNPFCLTGKVEITGVRIRVEPLVKPVPTPEGL